VGRSQWLSLCVASVLPQARQWPWSRLAIASFLFRRSFLSKHHLAAVQRHPYISTKVHAARHSLTASVCRSIGSTYAGLYCAAHPGALGAGTAQRTRRQRTAAIETLPRGPRCSSSNHLSVVQNLRPALNLCHYPSGHALRILSRRTLNPHVSQVERWQGTPASTRPVLEFRPAEGLDFTAQRLPVSPVLGLFGPHVTRSGVGSD
jgi:hypothetical protein